MLTACSKDTGNGDGNTASDFVKYLIPKGQQSSTPSVYKYYKNQSELRFIVKFDNSAIYRSVDPNNQHDLNKLYGFADDDKPHHVSSARIGWRWYAEELQLQGYVYNDGVMSAMPITSVPLNTEVSCSIRVEGAKYIFTVNGKVLEMTRSATSPGALGYRLFPFFGGQESAPHDVSILIREY
jgi:hypothetical protein